MNNDDTPTKTTDATNDGRELYPLPAFVTFAEPPSEAQRHAADQLRQVEGSPS